MNVTDLITDRMHENLKPRDIDEFEKYRWLVEMINFWIQHHGFLDLDTDEQTIIDFYYQNKDE